VNVSPDLLAQVIQTLQQEVYLGPPNPKETWVTTNQPNSGLIGTLPQTSAADALRTPLPGMHSIAANTAHIRFATVSANTWLSGSVPSMDWEASWNPGTVDEAEWTSLIDEVEREFIRLQTLIAGNTNWDAGGVTGVIGQIAHTAYHLGAIRQLLHWVKKTPA